jgi:hypothetical protein
MTYVEAYLATLYAALDKGGEEADIDRAVAEINNPSETGLRLWLESKPTINCSTCGIGIDPPEAPKPYDEVLCTTHASPS